MKLSEAIRLGAMMGPQGFLDLESWDGRTCALGAAAKAMGVNPRISKGMRYAILGMRWPVLDELIHCPRCSWLQGQWRRFRNMESDVEDVVIHLNDDHHWSREQIAAWVETFEYDDDLVLSHDEAQTLDAVDPTVRHTEARTTRA